MDELKQDMKEIKSDISDIKVDLKYHIKRTTDLEGMVKPAYHMLIILRFVIATALFVAALWVFKPAKVKAEVPYEGQYLAYVISHLEDITGCAVIINSGHRTPEKNKEVGGATNSYHLFDQARDITSSCVDSQTLGMLSSPLITTLIYDNHIHIDTRKEILTFKCQYKWQGGKCELVN